MTALNLESLSFLADCSPGSEANRSMVHTLNIQLETSGDVPIFQQIVDALARDIRTGVLPPAARLPPTRDLAEALKTHRNTVVRAYAVLAEAGFVHSHVGRGTFVAALLPQKAPQGLPHGAGIGDGQAPTLNEGAGLPWAALMSRSVGNEALRRGDRVASRLPVPGAVNLARFEPAPELRPAEGLRRCLDHVLRRYGPKVLGYAPREGVKELRRAISEDLVRRGIPATPEQVMVTSGSQQALDLLARAFIDPGDAFLVEEPTYAGVLNLLSAAGARPIGVPGDAEGPSPEALEQLGRQGWLRSDLGGGRPTVKGLYVMPNGSNPTGRTVTLERRRALVRWSRQSGIPLIEDDYGADMYLDAPPPPALRALDGQVVYVSTFSKKLAPALRIGFMVAPAGLQRELIPLKHAMDLGSSALLQHALAEFIERGYLAAHLAKVRPLYRERRDALCDALREHLPPEVVWERPTAGVLMWLRLPRALDPEVAFEAAHRHGVVVTPGSVHSISGEQGGGIRLAFCSEPPERLREGARRLGQALRECVAALSSREPRTELV